MLLEAERGILEYLETAVIILEEAVYQQYVVLFTSLQKNLYEKNKRKTISSSFK
jgi:hypothetical protein